MELLGSIVGFVCIILMFTITLQCKDHYYSHFTDLDTEALRGLMCQCHRDST